MWYNAKYDTYRPTTKEYSQKMREWQRENVERSKTNKAENWMWGRLNRLYKTHGIKFNRQRMRGTRIFDFWCVTKWIAIEVDWWYHNQAWKIAKDRKYDNYNKEYSGILVLRVEARDKRDMEIAMDRVIKECSRTERRERQKPWDPNKWFYEYIDELKKR